MLPTSVTDLQRALCRITLRRHTLVLAGPAGMAMMQAQAQKIQLVQSLMQVSVSRALSATSC